MAAAARSLDSSPDPPPDLEKRELPLETINSGSTFFRIHRLTDEALFFGPPGDEPNFRFDDPDGEFKICYVAVERDAAFVETFLRSPGRQLFSMRDLSDRGLAEIRVISQLELVQFEGAGLTRLGATAEITSSRHYALPQRWSRALWEHPAEPDGLLYRCRHDDSLRAVALFDRARKKVKLLTSVDVLSETLWLSHLTTRYGFGLTP